MEYLECKKKFFSWIESGKNFIMENERIITKRDLEKLNIKGVYEINSECYIVLTDCGKSLLIEDL